jgi:hypothetical protein
MVPAQKGRHGPQGGLRARVEWKRFTFDINISIPVELERCETRQATPSISAPPSHPLSPESPPHDDYFCLYTTTTCISDLLPPHLTGQHGGMTATCVNQPPCLVAIFFPPRV